MTRMTGPDCAVMCNLINTHTYLDTYIHTYIHTYCCSTSHGLMGGARFLGLEGGVTRRVGHGAPCLSDSHLYLLRQAARNQLYGYGRERS